MRWLSSNEFFVLWNGYQVGEIGEAVVSDDLVCFLKGL